MSVRTMASYITRQASQSALHQFCDALRVHSQHDSYFPITQSLGAQQYGVTLLRGKAPHGCPHTTKLLPFEGKLFRAQRGVDRFRNGRGLADPALRDVALSSAKQIHGQVVGYTKQPTSEVFLSPAGIEMAHQAEKRFLNYVLGFLDRQVEAAQIRHQRWPDLVIKLDDVALAF